MPSDANVLVGQGCQDCVTHTEAMLSDDTARFATAVSGAQFIVQHAGFTLSSFSPLGCAQAKHGCAPSQPGVCSPMLRIDDLEKLCTPSNRESRLQHQRTKLSSMRRRAIQGHSRTRRMQRNWAAGKHRVLRRNWHVSSAVTCAFRLGLLPKRPGSHANLPLGHDTWQPGF